MKNRAIRGILPAVVLGVLLLGAGRPEAVVPSEPEMFHFLPAGAELSPEQEIDVIESSLGERHVSGASYSNEAASIDAKSVAFHEEKRTEVATEEVYRRAEPHVKKSDVPAAKLLAGMPGMPQRLQQSAGGAAAAGTGTDGGATPRREEGGVLVLHETAAGVNRPLRESMHEAVAYHSIRNGYIPDGATTDFNSRTAARRKTPTAHDNLSQKQSKNSNYEPKAPQQKGLQNDDTTETADETALLAGRNPLNETRIPRTNEAINRHEIKHQGRTEKRTNPEHKVPGDRTTRPA